MWGVRWCHHSTFSMRRANWRSLVGIAKTLASPPTLTLEGAPEDTFSSASTGSIECSFTTQEVERAYEVKPLLAVRSSR